MATNHTTNYELSQWLSADQVLRTDFNADNAKIDAALAETAAAVPRIAVGSYTGSGASARTILVGFTPKAVILCSEEGITYDGYASGYTTLRGGLILPNCPLRLGYGSVGSTSYQTAAQITTNGFTVCQVQLTNNHNVECNASGVQYHYLAVG